MIYDLEGFVVPRSEIRKNKVFKEVLLRFII